MPDDHYDVIIIGTGAGGGTLAHRLAPSGKRILLVERGDVRHVLDEHGFEDGTFFYRFADDAPGAVARGRPAGGASTATG